MNRPPFDIHVAPFDQNAPDCAPRGPLPGSDEYRAAQARFNGLQL
jgi:hypothetical protein